MPRQDDEDRGDNQSNGNLVFLDVDAELFGVEAGHDGHWCPTGKGKVKKFDGTWKNIRKVSKVRNHCVVLTIDVIERKNPQHAISAKVERRECGFYAFQDGHDVFVGGLVKVTN